MKLSLKSVKYSEHLSEETPAFTATLCDDGVPVAYVKNEGHGGGNYVHPYNKGDKYESIRKYDNLDVECEIFNLVYEYDFVTKNQSKKFCLRNGEEYATVQLRHSISHLKKLGKLDAVVSRYKKNNPEWEIINRNI